MEIARSGRAYYCDVHMPTFRIVWLLRNLSLGGELFLRDKQEAVSDWLNPHSLGTCQPSVGSTI